MRTDVKGTRATLRHSGTAPNKVRAVLGLAWSAVDAGHDAPDAGRRRDRSCGVRSRRLE